METIEQITKIETPKLTIKSVSSLAVGALAVIALEKLGVSEYARDNQIEAAEITRQYLGNLCANVHVGGAYALRVFWDAFAGLAVTGFTGLTLDKYFK